MKILQASVADVAAGVGAELVPVATELSVCWVRRSPPSPPPSASSLPKSPPSSAAHEPLAGLIDKVVPVVTQLFEQLSVVIEELPWVQIGNVVHRFGEVLVVVAELATAVLVPVMEALADVLPYVALVVSQLAQAFQSILGPSSRRSPPSFSPSRTPSAACSMPSTPVAAGANSLPASARRSAPLSRPAAHRGGPGAIIGDVLPTCSSRSACAGCRGAGVHRRPARHPGHRRGVRRSSRGLVPILPLFAELVPNWSRPSPRCPKSPSWSAWSPRLSRCSWSRPSACSCQ